MPSKSKRPGAEPDSYDLSGSHAASNPSIAGEGSDQQLEQMVLADKKKASASKDDSFSLTSWFSGMLVGSAVAAGTGLAQGATDIATSARDRAVSAASDAKDTTVDTASGFVTRGMAIGGRAAAYWNDIWAARGAPTADLEAKAQNEDQDQDPLEEEQAPPPTVHPIPGDRIIVKRSPYFGQSVKDGPGAKYVRKLPPDGTPVEVLEVAQATNSKGLPRDWVHFRTVTEGDGEAVEGWHYLEGFADAAEYADEAWTPEATWPMDGLGDDEKKVAIIWNEKGGYITAKCASIGIPVDVATAFMAVESPGGRGFSALGKPIIRFETHRFKHNSERVATDVYKNDPEWFDAHFRIPDPHDYDGHEFRETESDAWQAYHGSQTLEWKAFELAYAKDPTAAIVATSFGSGQMMGFHYAMFGCDSPQDFYDTMMGDTEMAVATPFRFLEANREPAEETPWSPAHPGTPALAVAEDWDTLAELYNGSGQIAKYSRMLSTNVAAFRRLQEKFASKPEEEEDA